MYACALTTVASVHVCLALQSCASIYEVIIIMTPILKVDADIVIHRAIMILPYRNAMLWGKCNNYCFVCMSACGSRHALLAYTFCKYGVAYEYDRIVSVFV